MTDEPTPPIDPDAAPPGEGEVPDRDQPGADEDVSDTRDATRHDEAEAAGGDRDGEPDGDHERHGRHRTGHELAEIAGVPTPRPPKRTGVFIDADDLRNHVGGLLRAILGGYEVDAFGNFTFTHEDARIFVTVGGSPIGPQVGVFSVTNLDLDLTPPLAAFLLTTNHTLGFGSFSYDVSNRAVWLRHTLLGTTLDLPELQSAVAAIATTAAHLDDAIQDRFGGRTFQEAPSEVQKRMEPPSPREDAPGPRGASGYL
jgi:hypothetical protein